MRALVLASASPARRRLLERAGMAAAAEPARIDEAAIRASLTAEGVTPRDQADALAEMKARRVAGRHPAALVLGSDQILEHRGEALGKPDDRGAALSQLRRLSGDAHLLHTAAVLVETGRPVWRFVARARLHMRAMEETELEAYLDQAWPEVAGACGAYHLEGLGVRLFAKVEGCHFAIQGLPLVEVLAYLSGRGEAGW